MQSQQIFDLQKWFKRRAASKKLLKNAMCKNKSKLDGGICLLAKASA